MKRVSIALGLAFALSLAGCGEEGEIEIHSIDPHVGAMQGEQPVKIAGDNFRTDIGYTVYFGNKKSNQVTILDEKTLLVKSPEADEAGAVDLIISADTGAAWKVKQGYQYEDMSGSVMEQVGETEGGGKGQLAY